MADELSDAEVMTPQAQSPRELSDDDVMQPQPAGRQGGLLQAPSELFNTIPKAAELLTTPEGRAKLMGGVEAFGSQLLDFFKTPGKAVSQGLTQDQEIEFSVNAALASIGGTEFPKASLEAVKPIIRQFDDTVTAPAVQRMAAAETAQMVVDAYHGSNAVFDKFESRFLGTGVGGPASTEGHFFTSDPKVASGFSGLESGNVSHVQLSLDNPLIRTAGDIGLKDIIDDEDKLVGAIQEAKSAGHDALIIKNSDYGDLSIVFNDNAINKIPFGAVVKQARDLGVIGRPETPPAESPAKAAARAIPAERIGDDKVTMTPAGEPIDQWQQRFNDWVSRIKVPDDVRGVIERSAVENDYFPEARAGEVSPAHVNIVANAAGIDPAKIDVAAFSSKFQNPTKVRMVKQALDQALDDYKNAATAVNNEASENNVAGLLEAKMRRDYVVEYALGLRAEWGRTGHALNDLLESTEKAQITKDILGDKGYSPQDLIDEARGMEGLTDDQMAKALSNNRGKDPHWLYWMWQQGLISGLVTHTGYAATNGAFTYLERVISPGIAALMDKAKGGERKMFLGEAAAAHWGAILSVPDALRAAQQAFLTNARVPLTGEMELAARLDGKAPTPYPAIKPNWGLVGKLFGEKVTSKAEAILGVPGRGANLMHTFFKVLNQGMARHSIAYREAASEGLSPVSTDFWARYQYHALNPTDKAMQESIDAAYSGAFMEKLGDKSQAWAGWARGNPFFKWVFPFQHIPLNIVRAAASYSPAAVLGPEMRAALFGEKGQAAQSLAMAKMTVGSTIMGYFAYKGLRDEVTGDYPTDPKERERWRLLNIQPFSIKSGDQWISMDRLGPPGIVAKVGAEMAQLYKRYDGSDDEAMMKAVWGAAHGAANILGDEAGYQSVKHIVDALEDPRHAARYVGYQVGSLIPFSSFISQNASAIDPYMREAHGLFESLKYRMPELREHLLPKRDPLYGTPVENPGYLGQPGITAGFFRRVGDQQADPVKAELDRLHYYPGPPRAEIGGVKLTPEQFDKYEATAGPLVRQTLNNLVRNPAWRQIPDAQKRQLMQSMITAMRQRAAATMQAAEPQIIRDGLALAKKKAGLQ